MAGKAISAWVDERVANGVDLLAKVEQRPPAHLIGAAVRFYLALPEEGQSALRKIEALGTPEQVQWAMRKVAGALIAAQHEIAAERLAARLKPDEAPPETEEEVQAAAVAAIKKARKARRA